jgi:hypothetical protein
MSPRTRIVLGVGLAAATATVTAACSTGVKTGKPMTASPVAVTVTTASPTPSVSAAPSATPTASPPAPDGRITVKQLTAHKVTIPTWTAQGCQSGKQSLHMAAGSINHDSNQNGLLLYKVVYTNLDSDSALETAALVTCQFGEAATAQVIAFDRDSAGHIVTKGTVAHGTIWSMTARAAGGVTVDVSDYEACCSTPKAIELHQTRSYAYRSGHFAQVAGPTSFVPHTQKIDLSIKVSSISWSIKRDDLRTATLTVKVANNSGVKSGTVQLFFDDPNENTNVLTMAPLAAHTTITKTIKVSVLDDGYGGDCHIYVHELGSYSIGGDAKPSNDWATVPSWT